MDQLVAILGGIEVGRVFKGRSGRLSFIYDESWQANPEAYPLSLSMPLALSEHSHAKIDAFLWGLLPDNDRIIQTWAQRYQVSPLYIVRIDRACGTRLCRGGPICAPGAPHGAYARAERARN